VSGLMPIAQLEWEVEKLGVAFDGAGLGSGPPQIVDGSPRTFDELALGLVPGKPHHWRARLRTNNPLFPVTPWFTLPGNNRTETKLRTPPSGGGGPQVLFSDGFESGGLTAGGWARQNSNSFVTGNAARTGSYGARVERTSWIQRMVNTTGFATIELRYSRRTFGLDHGENLFVEWSTNGSTWNSVETTQGTSWVDQAFTLPSTAGNNSGFRIRFRTKANQTSERADIDDVEVVGTP